MTRLRLLALALVALTAAGCEEDVDPTLGVDATFTLYGRLDPTADQQAVRVVPITETIDAPTDVVGATVTSTDLETGAVEAWRDSVVTYPDGSTGHVYVADFTPRPGSRVRLEAARPDGEAAAVEVTIPPIIRPEVAAPRAAPGEVVFPIRFDGAPRVIAGQLQIVVRGAPGAGGEARTFGVPIEARPVEVAPDRWVVDVPFASAVREFLVLREFLGVRLVAADYVAFVVDETWDPPSDDPAALAEPGVFSNVTGGLGFVGAGYRATARWIPSATVQAAAGFTVDRDPASYVSINEIQGGPGGWVELYNPLVSDVAIGGYGLTDAAVDPLRQTLAPGLSVPALGFLTVDLAFSADPGEFVGLYGRQRDLVTQVFLERTAAGATYGAFPDGESYQLPSSLGGVNVFRGPLAPTRNGSNRLGLDVAAVNEVYTEGAVGWAEAVVLGQGAAGLRLMSAPDGYLEAPRAAGGPFWVADEGPGLELVQGGGDVYLAATYADPRLLDAEGFPAAPRARVVDVRRYAGQTVGLSDGYFPDAPAGAWTAGLRPTRGAANAASRLGR